MAHVRAPCCEWSRWHAQNKEDLPRLIHLTVGMVRRARRKRLLSSERRNACRLEEGVHWAPFYGASKPCSMHGRQGTPG